MNCYGLGWNIGHLAFAAYAADAIICHNIWLGGKTEKEEYTQYGLTPLVYTEHPESKLSVEAFPLQFMLCLLDTIEPIKRFEDTLSPREILQGIKLDYITNNEIVISWAAIIAQQKGFKRWKKGVVDTKSGCVFAWQMKMIMSGLLFIKHAARKWQRAFSVWAANRMHRK